MHRISLENTVFEGENNAYLFVGEETVLVDPGVATTETRSQLVRGLNRHGTEMGDVDRVFLTHYHADHSGLAGEIQRTGDATVHVHPGDAPLVEGDEAAWEEYRTVVERRLVEWGMPQEEREPLVALMTGDASHYGDPVEATPMEDGDRFEFAGTPIEVMHTPGHSLGSCTLVLADRNEALTGDALLPVYTPNVGGADVRVDQPLRRYVETLHRIESQNFDVAWPGHRDPIDDPADRARTIVDHHRERMQRVVDAVDSLGRADAWTVSAELFGDLEGIHVLHGPGEAYAHLEHLERHGVLVRDDHEYRLADGDAARDDLLEDTGY